MDVKNYKKKMHGNLIDRQEICLTELVCVASKNVTEAFPSQSS